MKTGSFAAALSLAISFALPVAFAQQGGQYQDRRDDRRCDPRDRRCHDEQRPPFNPQPQPRLYPQQGFHSFSVGETVVVTVAQGRTTGTVARIDGDGFMVVDTPSGYDTYQGPESQVLWTLQSMNGFNVGEEVVVTVAQGRTTGTIARIDSDGFCVVNTGSGYDNYQGPITNVLSTETGDPNSTQVPSDWHVGDTAVVTVAQGRTVGTIARIDGDDFCIVNTPSGYDNYQGPLSGLLRSLQSLWGFNVGETVAVTVAQGRTTGTIARIDSDSNVVVNTGSGYDNYQGPIQNIFHVLQSMSGFSVGETVVVIVAQGRTTGTIARIDSDGFVIVNTPSGYDNYQGPISGLIPTQ